MNPWLIAGAFCVLVVWLFGWSLCRAAAVGDEQAERAHAEHERRQTEAEEWEAA